MTLESKEEIKVGMEVRFAELWDGNGDGAELLESGSVSPNEEDVVGFEVVAEAEESLDTLVRITSIY